MSNIFVFNINYVVHYLISYPEENQTQNVIIILKNSHLTEYHNVALLLLHIQEFWV